MSKVAVVNVDTVATGLILTGAHTVFIGSNPVAIVGSTIAPHKGHVGATISVGSTTVFVENEGLARQGDLATCGDTVDSGNGNVNSG